MRAEAVAQTTRMGAVYALPLRPRRSPQRALAHGAALAAVAFIAAPVALAAPPGQPQPQKLWHVFPLDGQGSVTSAAAHSSPRTSAAHTTTKATSSHRATAAPAATVATHPGTRHVHLAGSGWSHWQWFAVGFVGLQLAAGMAWWLYSRRKHLGLRIPFGLTSRVRGLAAWCDEFRTSRFERPTVWSDHFVHRRTARLRLQLSKVGAPWPRLRAVSATALAATHRLAAAPAGARPRSALSGLAGRLTPRPRWRARESQAEPETEAAPGLVSAVDRIRTYGVAALARADTPESAAVAEEPEPIVANEGAEVVAYAAEASAPSGEDADDLVGLLRRRIAEARNEHRALTVVGARLADTNNDLAIDPHQLEQQAEIAAGDAIRAPTSADFSVDRDEAIVWLVLSGVLPKRAAAISRRLDELLVSAGVPVLRTAAFGYPRDADCAEALVMRCREVIATFREQEVARDPGELDVEAHAKHPTIDRLDGVLVDPRGSRRLNRWSGRTLDVLTLRGWKKDEKPAASEDGSNAVEDRYPLRGLAALSECLAAELEVARRGRHALSLAVLRLPAKQKLALALVAEAGRKAEIFRALEKFEVAVDDENDVLWLVLPGLLPRRGGELADTLRAALDPDGQTEAPVVVGYPSDGATAAALVDRCLAAVRAPLAGA